MDAAWEERGGIWVMRAGMAGMRGMADEKEKNEEEKTRVP